MIFYIKPCVCDRSIRSQLEMPNAGLDDNALGDSAVRIMTLLSMDTYQIPDSLTCSASTRGFNLYEKRESNISIG